MPLKLDLPRHDFVSNTPHLRIGLAIFMLCILFSRPDVMAYPLRHRRVFFSRLVYVHIGHNLGLELIAHLASISELATSSVSRGREFIKCQPS